MLASLTAVAVPPPDIRTVPTDLEVPAVADGQPAAGKRVKLFRPGDEGTQLYHLLYLPTNWQPGQTYPVIVEYAQVMDRILA